MSHSIPSPSIQLPNYLPNAYVQSTALVPSIGQSQQSAEEQVNQLELDADAEAINVPEAQRAAYRLRMRQQIAAIRTTIATMRAQGFGDNAINQVIGGLMVKFHESKSQFLEGNKQFALNKAHVVGCQQATAEKIRQCTVNFSEFVRPTVFDEEYEDEEPDYLNGDFDALPRLDEVNYQNIQDIPNIPNTTYIQQNQHLIQKDRALILDNMQNVRMLAATAEGVMYASDEVLKFAIWVNKKTLEYSPGVWAVKKVCHLNSTTEAACKSVRQGVKSTMNGVKSEVDVGVTKTLGFLKVNTPTNIKTFVKKQVAKMKTVSDSVSNFFAYTALKNMTVYNIPAEMTQQYIQDCTLLTGVAVAGVAGGVGCGAAVGGVKVTRNLTRGIKEVVGNRSILPSNRSVKELFTRFMKDESGTLKLPGNVDPLKQTTVTTSPPRLSLVQETMQQIFERATRIPFGSNVIPNTIDVHGVMNSNLVYDLGSSAVNPVKFKSSLEQLIKESLSVSEFVFKPLAQQPNSGNVLYSIATHTGSPVAVVKEFIATRSPVSGFIPEVVSITHLQNRNLNYSALPDLLGLAKFKAPNGGEKGIAIYRFIPGQTVEDAIVSANHMISAREIGRAIGEINTFTNFKPVSGDYLASAADYMLNMAGSSFSKLQQMGFSTRFTMNELQMVAQDAMRNPGICGMMHGDFHYGNVIFDASKVTLIDTGSVLSSINRAGVPHGLPAFDRHTMRSNIIAAEDYQAFAGLETTRTTRLLSEYDAGYREIYQFHESTAADRFAEVFSNVYYLNLRVGGESNPFLINRVINRLETQLAPPKVNGTIIMSVGRVAQPQLMSQSHSHSTTNSSKSSQLTSKISSLLSDESGGGRPGRIVEVAQRIISKTNLPQRAPQRLPAFPKAELVKSKANVQGGGVARKRWKDNKNIYEWDSRHGYVEVYDLRGKNNKGKFDPVTGERMSDPNPRKIITP